MPIQIIYCFRRFDQIEGVRIFKVLQGVETQAAFIFAYEAGW